MAFIISKVLIIGLIGGILFLLVKLIDYFFDKRIDAMSSKKKPKIKFPKI